MTAYAETANGIVVPFPRVARAGTDALAATEAMVDVLESRLASLELAIEDRGWRRLAGTGAEFGRRTIADIADLARVYYLKNPLVRRAVEIDALYVWGQNLSVKTKNDLVRQVVDRFWTDNARTLTGQQASRSLHVELRVTGNLFLALFADRITGAVRVRHVPMEEIVDIVTNPEDRAEVWFYERRWMETPLTGGPATEQRAYYPDMDYDPADKPAQLSRIDGTFAIQWDTPVAHRKIGAFPHWRWGVSPLYAALDWAKAYKELLEDDATRSRALAKFVWKLTTAGGKSGVANAKAKLGTTLGIGNLGETNPPPVAGSAYVRGDLNNDLDPIRIAGATLDPDHSRPVRLMAAAALATPDHFFDANQSNLATSKTLDRPTELDKNEQREDVKDFYGRLLQWVLDADIAALKGILPRAGLSDADREIELSFPDILEPDVVARVQATVMAATLSGSPPAGFLPDELVSRRLMGDLGVDDIDGEYAKLVAQQEQAKADAERAAKDAAAQQAKQAADLAKQQAQQTPQQPGQPAASANGKATGANPPAVQPAQPAESLAEAGQLTTVSDLLAIVQWGRDALPEEYRGVFDARIVAEDEG